MHPPKAIKGAPNAVKAIFLISKEAGLALLKNCLTDLNRIMISADIKHKDQIPIGQFMANWCLIPIGIREAQIM